MKKIKKNVKPSTIPAIFPFKSCMQCWDVVGLGFPDVFALGAASGNSNFC